MQTRKQRRQRMILYLALCDLRGYAIPIFISRTLNMAIWNRANAIAKQRTHVHRDIRRHGKENDIER
jgi:hypothetical protein